MLKVTVFSLMQTAKCVAEKLWLIFWKNHNQRFLNLAEQITRNDINIFPNSHHMQGRSTRPIWNNSLFLRLHKSAHESNPDKLLIFKVLWIVPRVHQSTSQIHPTRGRFLGAIRNNFWLLRLHELVHECTSPPVKYLPHMDHQWLQSRRTPCF